jgi:hypothetical protein
MKIYSVCISFTVYVLAVKQKVQKSPDGIAISSSTTICRDASSDL